MKDALREAADMPAHKWWSVGGGFNAELQRVVIVVLAQPCSSSSCERVNSEADHIKGIKANRMLTESMQRHLRVHHNLNLVDNVSGFTYAES